MGCAIAHKERKRQERRQRQMFGELIAELEVGVAVHGDSVNILGEQGFRHMRFANLVERICLCLRDAFILLLRRIVYSCCVGFANAFAIQFDWEIRVFFLHLAIAFVDLSEHQRHELVVYKMHFVEMQSCCLPRLM